MKLQTKVTLGSVLLATFIVILVSSVDLYSFMQLRLQSTYERAETIKDAARFAVIDALNSRRDVAAPEALRASELKFRLLNLMRLPNGVFSIDVVSAENLDVIASTLPNRIATKAADADFGKLVRERSWLQQVNALVFSEGRYYMLQDPVGSNDKVLFWVQVVIYPALIHPTLTETLYQKLGVAVLSIAGAVFVTFLFSMALFRALGHIGQLLDRFASGEYGPVDPASANSAKDELSVMASKVNLLGERLRGAQYEVSDLRGNIDHLLQDLEDAVFIFNRDFRLVFASGSVEKFLGRDRATLPGQTLSAVFPPATFVGLLVAQASENGVAVRNRRVPTAVPGQTAPGPAVVLLSVDTLEAHPGGNGGNGILVRLRDAEAKRKIDRQLQTADRLTAISRISSGVAHEVKNPLNAILLHVEVARSKLSRGDTAIEEQMEIIAREILRLDRVVRTFLDFTRPVELQLQTVPMQELVREIVDLARPQTAAGNITVSVKQETEGVDVRVDRDLLKQAVLNVMVNAMQAMPQGGELHFEASTTRDMAELRISDTGPGILPELREKIFRLYFTTKTQGSGIGLAMTFRIVQLHDGTIDFTSEPGKGTTFLIRLPIAV
ncbi:MAG: ATP-binding protein [Candidatus Solibacter sp.]